MLKKSCISTVSRYNETAVVAYMRFQTIPGDFQAGIQACSEGSLQWNDS